MKIGYIEQMACDMLDQANLLAEKAKKLLKQRSHDYILSNGEEVWARRYRVDGSLGGFGSRVLTPEHPTVIRLPTKRRAEEYLQHLRDTAVVHGGWADWHVVQIKKVGE